MVNKKNHPKGWFFCLFFEMRHFDILYYVRYNLYMKTYLMLFTILLTTVFVFDKVFADQTNLITINSVSALLSSPGYISSVGKGKIVMRGNAPSGSEITIVLTDSANPSNSLTETYVVSPNTTSFVIGLDGTLAIPEALKDGLINVSAYIASSSATNESLIKTTIIQETVAPTIIIIGDNPFKCRVRTECPDLGAVAFDSFGNKLNVFSSSNVRTNTAGNYIIRYSTVDFAGNETISTRGVSISTRVSGLSSTTISYVAQQISTSSPATSSVDNIIQEQSAPSVQEASIAPIVTQILDNNEVPITVIQISGIVDTIKRQLKSGISGDDVKLIQTLLSHDSSVYPEALTTGYFGTLTQRAVQRFQEKYNIASNGVPGYGQVGPKTKAKLIEIYGQ